MTIVKAVPVANRLCAAVALMFLACSSGSPTGGAGGGKAGGGQGGGKGGGNGGTNSNADAGGGGQSGNGGTAANVDAGGGGQGGGNGGVDANPLTLPGCLSDLLSACPLATPCFYSANDAGDFSNVCFAAGATDPDGGARATVMSVLNPNGGNGDCGAHFTQVTVAKADGSPCYSFEIHEPVELDCTQHTWIWKDASGQIVATGGVKNGAIAGVAFNETQAAIMCAVGGDQTSCDGLIGASCCGVSPYGSLSCPDGVTVSACSPGACP